MNTRPHTHELKVSAGQRSWYLGYGDQASEVDFPKRWLWESAESYQAKCDEKLSSAMRSIVARHDMNSQGARYQEIAQATKERIGIPEALGPEKTDPTNHWRVIPRAEVWGSDVLNKSEVA